MKRQIGFEILEVRTLLSALPILGPCASAERESAEIWNWRAEALPELTVRAAGAEFLESASGAASEEDPVSDTDPAGDPVGEMAGGSSLGVIPLADGFFSVEFLLPGSSSQFVFLTGLRWADVAAIEAAIEVPCRSGQTPDFGTEGEETAFSASQCFLDDFSGNFPDAEKERGNSDDSAMCWAAVCANLLEFTGWGSSLGDSGTGERLFSNEDAIFDVFCKNFQNSAGHIFYGLDWFLTGACPVQGNALWSQLEVEGSGGFHADHSALESAEACRDVFSYDFLRDTSDLEELTNALRGGYGIGLSMGWYLAQAGYVRDDGHSATCWGFLYDAAFGTDSPEHYVGLLISDSDDSRQEIAEESPNELHLVGLGWDEDQAEMVNGYPVFLTDYPASSGSRLPFVETYVKLAPMSRFSDDGTDGEGNGSGENAETVCRFDLNGDGKTAIRDLILFAHQYGKETAGNEKAQRADFNGDADVNIQDLIAFAKHYGRECRGTGSCAVPIFETTERRSEGETGRASGGSCWGMRESVSLAVNEKLFAGSVSTAEEGQENGSVEIPVRAEFSAEILDRIFAEGEWGS